MILFGLYCALVLWLITLSSHSLRLLVRCVVFICVHVECGAVDVGLGLGCRNRLVLDMCLFAFVGDFCCLGCFWLLR